MPDNKYPEDKKLYWDTFQNHIIERDGEGFVYHKPGTRIYLAYLYFRHNYIIIFGDVGPFVYNTDSPNSFQWTAGGLESESYVMSKLKGIYKAYDPKTTYEHLKESLTDDEDEENLKRLEQEKDCLDMEADAIQFVRDIGYDDECLCYTWDANSDAQWAYWILRTFMDKIKTMPPPSREFGTYEWSTEILLPAIKIIEEQIEGHRYINALDGVTAIKHELESRGTRPMIKVPPAPPSITDIYNRLKHLDKLLSDPQWLDGKDGVHNVAHDLWMAVKNAAEGQG